MSRYFSNPICSKSIVNVELDLVNHVTKNEFPNAAGLEPSPFAKVADLANEQ